MSDPQDRFLVTGQLVERGEPVGAWLEVQDEDVFLHDFLAAGRSRADGSFQFEFPRRAFNQQPWENEDVPDLVVYVWRDAPADQRPDVEDPPTHCMRFARDVFVDQRAELGPIELDDAARPGRWLFRQAITSRRPGGGWTLEELKRLSDEVRGWVLSICGPPSPPTVTLGLASLDDCVGCYQPEHRQILLDPTFLAELGPDAVRRLLAHEWAHATAHHATERVSDAIDLDQTGSLTVWALDMTQHVPLSAGDLATCLVRQAATANHEGYAHFVEERVVRRHLPLSAYPVQTLWQRAKTEARDRRVDEAAFRLWLAQHDAYALRQLGLAWYRHFYRRRRRVQFQRRAGLELLAACMDRFGRLVRGEGVARRAPRTEPWE